MRDVFFHFDAEISTFDCVILHRGKHFRHKNVAGMAMWGSPRTLSVPFCPPKPLPALGAPLIPVTPGSPSLCRETVKFTSLLASYQ